MIDCALEYLKDLRMKHKGFQRGKRKRQKESNSSVCL